jgi:alpha-amylase
MTGDHALAVGVGGSTASTSDLQYPGVPFGPNDFNQPQCGIDDYSDPYNVCKENSDFTKVSDMNEAE